MPVLIFPQPFLAATDWARLFADRLQPPSPLRPQHKTQRPQPQPKQPQPPSQQDDEDEDETVVPIRKPS